MVVRIINSDALTALRTLESESVQCVVTSPPYFQLRNYQCDGQIGLEQTPAEFIAKLIAVFDEVKRVCRNDATVWVNLGDSYAGSGKGPSNSLQRPASCLNDRQLSAGAPPREWNPIAPGLKAKDLMLIPERFAIAMQDAGWWVRSRIAWCKTSAMPESVRDRPTSAWEHLWLFSKSRTYYYDAEAVRQPNTEGTVARFGQDPRLSGAGPKTTLEGQGVKNNGSFKAALTHGIVPGGGANLRNYWLLGPEPSSLEHYAAYPTELVRRCILAGTSQRGCCPACRAPWMRVVEREVPSYWAERKAHDFSGRKAHDAPAAAGANYKSISHGRPENSGVGYSSTVTTGWAPSCTCDAGPPVPCVVLDPFLGSGTTAMVADRLQRDAIGIELSPTYVRLAEQRLRSDAGPMFADIEVAG